MKGIELFCLGSIYNSSGYAHLGVDSGFTSWKKVEDGLEFLPLCPQVRKTQQAPDAFLKLKNPLPASPENIFAGQTLFHFDAKP